MDSLTPFPRPEELELAHRVCGCLEVAVLPIWGEGLHPNQKVASLCLLSLLIFAE